MQLIMFDDSALLKLKSAGLPYESIPSAFADDAQTREEICKIALHRAQEHYQQRFSTIIYLGDGIWDARTSRNLGYPFIGIAHERDSAPLVAEGAVQVLPNFQNLEQFIKSLDEASKVVKPT